MSNDPTRQELARLRAPRSMPQRSVFVDGQRVKLTPEQYHDYVQLSGNPAKAWLDRYIKTPEWRGMTDNERREEVKETLEEFRESARDDLRRRYPDLASRDEAGAAEFVPPPPPGFQLVR